MGEEAPGPELSHRPASPCHSSPKVRIIVPAFAFVFTLALALALALLSRKFERHCDRASLRVLGLCHSSPKGALPSVLVRLYFPQACAFRNELQPLQFLQ